MEEGEEGEENTLCHVFFFLLVVTLSIFFLGGREDYSRAQTDYQDASIIFFTRKKKKKKRIDISWNEIILCACMCMPAPPPKKKLSPQNLSTVSQQNEMMPLSHPTASLVYLLTLSSGYSLL